MKGKRALSIQDIEKAKEASYFVLIVPRSKCVLSVNVPLGNMDLSEQFYTPVLDALVDGAKSLGQLMALVNAPPTVVLNVLLILIGVGYIHAASETVSNEDLISTKNFNRIALESNVRGEYIPVLVSPRLKAAFKISEINQYFLYFHLQSKEQFAPDVWALMKAKGKSMSKEGVTLVTEEENLRELSLAEARFKSEALPLLATFGMV